jgi:hypothetical protein
MAPGEARKHRRCQISPPQRFASGKGGGLHVLEPEFCTMTDTGRILVTALSMVAEMERRFI